MQLEYLKARSNLSCWNLWGGGGEAKQLPVSGSEVSAHPVRRVKSSSTTWLALDRRRRPETHAARGAERRRSSAALWKDRSTESRSVSSAERSKADERVRDCASGQDALARRTRARPVNAGSKRRRRCGPAVATAATVAATVAVPAAAATAEAAPPR